VEDRIEKIWLKFGDRLKVFILSRIHDESTADDILHDVFLKLHSGIDTLKDETKIQSWIYQIARNAITDHYRKIQKESRIGPHQSWDEEDLSDEYMEETLQDMVKMMDNLSPEYCEALCETELGGMSQIEYAKKIGISYSGAKSRVQRARNALKDLLMQCCHYQFDKYGTVIDIHPANCCICC
jgi:RNA polymerase sigma-70 factor (ECF subfamily)